MPDGIERVHEPVLEFEVMKRASAAPHGSQGHALVRKCP